MATILQLCFAPALTRRYARRLPPAAEWVYLGTNLRRRARAQVRLGVTRQRDIGRELTDAAYSIRDEYQNWMTAFGHCQPDARIWEAGITATRSPLLSDLFQFAAYMELLRGWMT